MNYVQWVWSNLKQWRAYKQLPKGFQRSDGKFPSETLFKYPLNYSFQGKQVLNLGCGKSVYKFPNVVNADVVPGDGVNVVWDFGKTPLPFETEKFDRIIANHVMEHVPNWWECFQELARILKPGGVLEIWCPPVSEDTAFTFRDHINIIGVRSFDGCGPQIMAGSNIWAETEFKKYTHVRRLLLKAHIKRHIMKWWIIFAPVSLARWMMEHLRNTVSEEGYFFKKLAEGEC